MFSDRNCRQIFLVYPFINLTFLDRMTSGQTGALFVTTLKLSFKLHVEKESLRSNKLLGDMDVPLSR